MRTSREVAEERAARLKQLDTLLEEYKTDKVDPNHGQPIYDYPAEVAVEIKNRQQELADLSDEYKVLADAEVAQKTREQIAEMNNVYRKYDGKVPNYDYQPNGQQGFKTLGQMVVESPNFKFRKQNKGKFIVDLPEVEMKTLFGDGRTPGYTPPNPRTPLVVPFANRPLRVADLIPHSTTELTSIKWMEETTFTNNASMTGEGYAKPESVVDYTERNTPVRKIAHYMQISDEMMDDIPGFMSLIDNDMVLMLRLKEEQQILSGSGIGQELTGFLSVSTLQSQAFSVNNADTILKAMTKVQWTGYGAVTAVIMHPTNWETTRLIKGATNQDYVLGSPLIDVQPRLWGVPVVITNAITVGTALVGDFAMFSEIRVKKGVTVDVSDSHASTFTSDILTIRAEMREALLVKRGSAFCQATSLT